MEIEHGKVFHAKNKSKKMIPYLDVRISKRSSLKKKKKIASVLQMEWGLIKRRDRLLDGCMIGYS